MDEVSSFYSGSTGLLGAIESALDGAGVDRAALRPADLAPVDEFHIRGRAASLEIVEALDISADCHVLDLGSGLGGPARTLAELTGCAVTGVDLTPSSAKWRRRCRSGLASPTARSSRSGTRWPPVSPTLPRMRR